MSDNNWVRIYDYMPPPDREINVKTEQGETVKTILRGSWVHPRVEISYYFKDANTVSDRIIEWQFVKEKRPDLRKLKCGDLLILEFKNGCTSFGKLRYYDETRDEISIFGECCLISFLNKVTRINVKERTFEDI